MFGTVTLLNAAAREAWAGAFEGRRFYHVSTDEGVRLLHDDGFFTEETPYDPQSPYSASKAASDHFACGPTGNTYGLPFVLSNCSNNCGSHHFAGEVDSLTDRQHPPEQALPVYGQVPTYATGCGWRTVQRPSTPSPPRVNGETYNIGGHNECGRDIDLVVKLLCAVMGPRWAGREARGEQLML